MEEYEGNVGFIGSGKMAYALANGILKSGLIQSENIWASAPTMNNLQKFQEMNCNVTHSNYDVLVNCTIIFLCVKPHLTQVVLEQLYSYWKRSHIIVSVISGKTIKYLEENTPPQTKIIRSMPNVSSSVLAGACAISRGASISESVVKMIKKLLETVGLCEEIHEDQMDAIGGLSGSGPAFGASKMILETGEHPEVLRDTVCSPGGTTITGIHALEKAGVRAAMMNAVEAATLKAKELGQM
ncbi:pyrroline-5-carboxylate reductase 3-like [Centruroides sculpturatus]|uniref:pyrroline-5-carboxylate reductase 3-like n=1 Tax=Centruroides sculpturatus TaxID=218467 RepID=UPI000C6CDBD4|nr:pyrroline-5-carboxylate reductase 3-like [Centruroides sculpturatus]